jgi:hypothetical protein
VHVHAGEKIPFYLGDPVKMLVIYENLAFFDLDPFSRHPQDPLDMAGRIIIFAEKDHVSPVQVALLFNAAYRQLVALAYVGLHGPLIDHKRNIMAREHAHLDAGPEAR